MKLQKTLSRILDGLILLVFLLFLSSAGFQDKMTSGWYQQYFPNLNGSTIKDVTFLDSLTGFAVTNSNSLLQEYILKTTNGGDNWEINYTYNTPNSNWYFTNIDFINSNTGFAFSWTKMFKTTNAGSNWEIMTTNLYPEDISIINKDTMLAVKSNDLNGGVYRTIDGGYNWQSIWSGGSGGNPQKIYMVNKDLGFILDLSYVMNRTTDGGFSWSVISGEGFKDIMFSDSNTGWKVNNEIRKTTNGGVNWFLQQTPNIINGFFIPSKLSVLNKDTVWMVGCYAVGGILLKTTNGGLNWGYQYPDPSLPVTTFKSINFVDSKHGWAYSIYGTENLLFHTKVGGNDTTFFTGLNNNINTVLSDYKLYQNYPNPFNTRTVVSCQLSVVSNVSIKVYDVQGHEVQTLVQGKLNQGVYEYIFNGNYLSSGIYFYSMIIDGKTIETKKMLMIK